MLFDRLTAIQPGWQSALLPDRPDALGAGQFGDPAPVVLVASVPRAMPNTSWLVPYATMSGTWRNDRMDGTAGADTIFGQNGHDRLYGRAGTDEITGGAGDDTIHGGDDRDKLYGWNDDDVIYGGRGNDGLYGNQGDDRLYGGGGDDWLCAGNGHDELTGGAGRDVFVFRPPEGDSRSSYLDFDLAHDALRIRGDLMPDGVQRGDVTLAKDGSLILHAEGGNEMWFPTLDKADIRALIANIDFI